MEVKASTLAGTSVSDLFRQEPAGYSLVNFQSWNFRKSAGVNVIPDKFSTYLKAIKSEHDLVALHGSELAINGEPLTDYEFRQNYYFMMGRYPPNSLDSRYWV